jgi:peptidoglycan/LPS O-acetylase OafA/YrhL
VGNNATLAVGSRQYTKTPMVHGILSGRIPELDSIRAIAIVLVIGCHYAGFSSLLGGLPSCGWIGVDIFFVLSGLLITSILIDLRGRSSSLRVFYMRRALRIWPLYFLMILVLSIASVACHEHLVHAGYYESRFLFLQSFQGTPALFHRAWLVLLNREPHHALFARTALPLAPIGAPLAPWGNALGVAWSLSIEEYFYVLWAPIVLFVQDRRKVGAAALVIFAASVIIQYLGFSGDADYFNFFCHIHSLMAGALMALLLRTRSRMSDASRRRTDRLLTNLAACLTAALLAILFLNSPILKHELRDSSSFMVLGLPICSVLFALALGWIIERRGRSNWLLCALRWRPACYLGTISYSLYLFHVPMYYGVLRCFTVLRLFSDRPEWMASIAALPLSILCSALSWKYFETPILRLKDLWAPTDARVLANATAAKAPA